MSTPPVTPPVTPPTETPAEAIAAVEADVTGDIAAVKADAVSVESSARAEYDTLAPKAQAAIHQAINDIETAFSVSLGGIHSLFGAK
jgi:hypothetical protein